MTKQCVAMLLAGGEGRRLGQLTRHLAKPAVHFGGKYRIIDFTLSNCTNSQIDTIGVLTQYQPMVLNAYLGNGSAWDLDRKHGGVAILPPYMKQQGGDWYKGTANAVLQNFSFIERYDPEYVLVISGDHVYKMDYDLMLQAHQRKAAAVTIAVFEVKWEEAPRFGIMSIDEDQRITHFVEKPKMPDSNLASMGVYLFNWRTLRDVLVRDEQNPESSHDFGKDIIPMMLNEGRPMYAYPFKGYWKDVGTIESLWQANMDLLDSTCPLQLHDRNWRIFSVNANQPAQYLAPTAKVRHSLVNDGCVIFGEVEHSVLFYGVSIGTDSKISHSVIMPNVKIGSGVKIDHAIIGEGTVVTDGCVVSGSDAGEITLVAEHEVLIGPYRGEAQG